MDMHSDLRPRQFRRVDAAPKKLWRMLQVEEFLPNTGFQLVDVLWCRIGERSFGLGPNLLIGIEFRRIGREVMKMEAAASTQVQADGLVPVDFGAVPQEHNLAAEVPEEQTKKLDDPPAVDVLAVAPEIHADPLASRGNRDRGDDRDPVVPVAMSQDRRLSDRRPGLTGVGGEHEAAFVEEDQMSAELTGVFLYRASRPVSIWQSPLPCAPSPGAPASARSIPSVAG